jgi:diketogulonate reductase-like aldo/keto reductase
MIQIPHGPRVSALGQGTWKMGERAASADDEAAVLRLGIELGLTLIDTAEIYADGGAELVVGQAIAGRREKVFLVSKVAPRNASATGVVRACEASLRRLGTEVLDLYLLHWPGAHPFRETLAGFEKLRDQGKIRHWGVSNFDTKAMREVFALGGGEACATNQVLYHPDARGVEFDLLPWCRGRGVPVMAYSPLGQGGRLLRSKALAEVAERHGATPAQVALAWSLRDGNTISIPKTANAERVRENAGALRIKLSAEDLAVIDAAHKPPTHKQALEML